MEANKNLLTKLIPYALILVCVAVISRFFSEPFTFPVNIDDCLYSALLQKHSIWELMQMLGGKYNGAYIAHFDGRLFSNFYSLLVFSILKTHHSIYYLYDLFMFFVLIGSFLFLFSSLQKNGFIFPLTKIKKPFLSLVVSCVLYIFLLDGRYEVFYWVSGISNHLLSIIFFVFALGIFISKPNCLRVIILAFIAFCFGQMNEAYAVNYFIVFLLLTIFDSKKGFAFVMMLLSVLISLYLNLSAHGTYVRFNTLYAIETHFNFMEALKDSSDTLLLPIINYRYLPIKIPVLILFYLALRDYFQFRFSIPEKKFLLINRLMLAGALLSIFMHCYILGEMCTYRGLLFYFLTLLYFIFSMASKNILNPIKLFFR
jgi:hypothetical protein